MRRFPLCIRRSGKACPAALAVLLLASAAAAQDAADTGEWIALFNGHDLEGWTAKIRGHASGENYANTFRVADGALTVSYDGYPGFDARYGHLFYRRPFSHYRVRLEYRFLGEPGAGLPRWAVRNSGIMLHAQAPETMPAAQDFPISVEFQFLGGNSDGKPRPTGSMCSPGTEVVIDGKRASTHCVQSSSPTFDGEQWVRVEALVLGSERIAHYVNGKQVIEYTDITVGGDMVSAHRPEMKHDGQALGEGYLALQSEGHAVQFRNVELLNLGGCMDPRALNYKRYFVAPDTAACRY